VDGAGLGTRARARLFSDARPDLRGWRRDGAGGAAPPGVPVSEKRKWSSRCSRRPRVLSKYASIAWGGDVISPPHALVAPSLLDSPQHSSRPASGVADGLRCNRI